MIPSNTLIDSSRPTCVVVCGNKTKKNVINERKHIDTLNEACNPLNENIYYLKERAENVIVLLYELVIVMDHPGK